MLNFFPFLFVFFWSSAFVSGQIIVQSASPFNLKILRQDVDKYIKSDSDVNKLEQKVTYIETTVDYLERTLKLISNRTFTIKNAIDWKKFTSGVI